MPKSVVPRHKAATPSGPREAKQRSQYEVLDEEKAAEEDTGDPDTRVVRTIDFSNSVYDDALLSPLISRSHACRSWSMLLLNLLLQVVVLLSIKGVVRERANEDVNALYGVEGLCYSMPASKVPQFNSIGTGPPQADALYKNCAPHEVFTMYNWSGLDLDGDGAWSPGEALTMTKRASDHHDKQLQLDGTHTRMLAMLSDSAETVLRMDRYSDRPEVLDHARTVLKMLNESDGSIPHTVYLGEIRPFLDMCLVMDDQLCGNIVWRRSFNRSHFMSLYKRSGLPGEAPLAFLEKNPHSGGTVHDVMRLCQLSIREICPSFFTVGFGLWSSKRKEVCGASSTTTQLQPESELVTKWDRLTKELMVVEFSKSAEYQKLQISPNYVLFLILILMLWSMSMIEEIRVLVKWWRVLLGEPAPGVKIFDATEDDEHSVVMSDISAHYWKVNVFVSLGPRTVICGLVLFLGTQYLITSRCYEDLILNSLALTFLITIDEMAFNAFVPDRRKHWISDAGAMEAAPSRRIDAFLKQLLSERLITMLITAYVMTHMFFEYRRHHGKLELAETFRCICQSAGEKCMAAAVVGGYPYIRSVPGFEGQGES